MTLDKMQPAPDRSQEQDPASSDLFERLSRFFRPPVFPEDQERTRVAQILTNFLYALFVGILLLPVSSLLLGTGGLPQMLVVAAILVPVILYSLFSVRQGVVRRTATIFVALMWLIQSGATWLFGGITNNPMLVGIFLVLVLAGFLIGSRVAALFGALSIFNILILFALSNQIDLPNLLEPAAESFYQAVNLVLVIFTFLVVILNNSFRQAILQAQESGQALRESNRELENIRTYLEEEVARNTSQLERRSQYLEAAARVANASIASQDLRQMLEIVAGEISDRFSFYHVGIFLLDERREWAVMRAASSAGGRSMIARNHRLAVGRQGIVGFVTSIGQPRISQDIELDRIHAVAPELPDTRSEMALPLVSRGVVIGAIDIQDNKPNAFQQEDIVVLQTMADQVALAIENILLYQQTQDNLEEIQRVYGQYSEEAWRDIRQKQMLASYRYFGGAITRIENSEVPTLLENKVSIPVQVRGVSLGAIEISKGDDLSVWSDEEMKLLSALAEQIGIALDSARLFNESQLRATTEHTIGEINSQLWESLDINTILKTTANNLREKLALPELTIRMSAPDGSADPAVNGSENGDQTGKDN
jgi:GAF domain-containing protein